MRVSLTFIGTVSRSANVAVPSATRSRRDRVCGRLYQEILARRAVGTANEIEYPMFLTMAVCCRLWGRRRPASGQAVVLGDPVAAIAELIAQTRQVERFAQRVGAVWPSGRVADRGRRAHRSDGGEAITRATQLGHPAVTTATGGANRVAHLNPTKE